MLILQMLKLQTKLNNDTNGIVWLQGKTKENREINWHRCIYMEAVEALDSFNWKHWKNINAGDNMDNIVVEVVDIWHFIMSENIYQNKQDLLEKYENNTINFDREKLIISLEKIVNLASSYHDIAVINIEFFNTIKYLGLSIEDLYRNYLVKNILNQFRQDNGYKNNTYKKIWNGVEDNVIAFNMLEKDNTISVTNLYQELQTYYKNI